MKLPKYVQDVSGNLYFRRTFRSGGKSRTTRHALPPITDPMFAVRYQELLRGPKPTERDQRSIAHLIHLYRISQQYRGLAPATRATRDMYLRLIEDAHGEKAYAALDSGKVEQLRDEMADTPGKANNFVATLRLLYTLAIKRKLVGLNPCAGIGRLKIGEHQPWPAAVIQQAMDVASPMTRLAIALHLFTGQRISDVCRMEWSHIKDNAIYVVQQKTGVKVWIPIHSTLKAELARVPRHVRWMLYNEMGNQMTRGRLQERLLVVWRRLGVRYRWHGLRKNLVNNLLEAGCSTSQVSAITGQSLALVEHYARGRDVKALAVSAMQKWESA